MVIHIPEDVGTYTVMICPACGASPAHGDRFCSTCGLALAGLDSQTPGVLLRERYRVQHLLHAAGAGSRYLVEDVTTRTTLVVHQLGTHALGDEDDRAQAARWFNALATRLESFRHPGIAVVQDHWVAPEPGGPYFLVTAYVPGLTLADEWEEAERHVPWRQAVDWALAICEALAYLHGSTPQYVHGHLRPEHVVLDSRTGAPVLVEFGLAAALSGRPWDNGAFAPFEAHIGRAVPQTDLYSLGAMLHALIGGRDPDRALGHLLRAGSDLQRSLRRLYPPLDASPSLPHALPHVIARATAFSVEDRYPHAAALHAALQDLLGPVVAVQHTSADPPQEPVWVQLGLTREAWFALPAPARNARLLSLVKGGPPAALPTAAPPASADMYVAPTLQAVAPGQPGDSPVLRVGDAGPGSFRTIAEALAVAEPGTRIEIRPGRYTDPLLVNIPIELTGLGPPGDTVVELGGAACLTIGAEGVVMRGLTIHHRQGNDTGLQGAIVATSGTLLLEDCVIRGEVQVGLYLAGDARATLRRSRIAEMPADGIVVEGHASLVLEDCTFSALGLAGLRLRGSRAVELHRCTFRDSATGVVFEGQARGLIEDSEFLASSGPNVMIREGSDPVLRRCHIRDGQDHGVVVTAYGKGTLEECEIHGHVLAGVAISRDAHPTLQGCAIRDGNGVGVLVEDGGRGAMVRCTLSGNVFAEIRVACAGDPLFTNCRIHDGLGIGIDVHAAGLGTFEDCTVAACSGASAAIAEQSRPVLRRCSLSDGHGAGVVFDKDGQGTLEDCVIAGHAGAGVQIANGDHAVIRGCRINRNAGAGIAIQGGGGGTIEGCDLTGNEGGPWFLDPESVPGRIQRRRNKEDA